MKKEMLGNVGRCYDNWGTPTADALIALRAAVPEALFIASGGIRNGLEMAKAMALGADYLGMAPPLLKPATQSAGAVKSRIAAALQELKIAMFCCGVQILDDFKAATHIIEPRR
jgi:isopentenyl-diphosphate delta-isomerase